MYTDSTNTQHEVEHGARRFRQQPAAEGRQLAGAFGDFVLERLQRGLALFDEVHVEAVAGRVCLQVRDRLVGFVDDVRQVVRERPHLIGDRVGEQHADPGERQEESEVHGEHRQTAGEPRSAAGRRRPG